jgi:hypothetical protein
MLSEHDGLLVQESSSSSLASLAEKHALEISKMQSEMKVLLRAKEE